MRYHVPNVIALRVRIALALCAVVLLMYMAAGLATGYTYIPGRRGGYLLSGLPTVLIVLSASALFFAALLTIVDHYDRRPNEVFYVIARGSSLRAALYLFIAAPFVEMTMSLLLASGIDVSRYFHGFAGNCTFYDASLQPLARFLDPVFDYGWLIALLSLGAGGIALLIDEHPSIPRRFVALLLGTSLLGGSLFWLAGSSREFLLGQVKAGRRFNQYVVRADQDPAKFNAILLTKFTLGGMVFTGSAFLVIAAATGRLSPSPSKPRSKTAVKESLGATQSLDYSSSLRKAYAKLFQRVTTPTGSPLSSRRPKKN